MSEAVVFMTFGRRDVVSAVFALRALRDTTEIFERVYCCSDGTLRNVDRQFISARVRGVIWLEVGEVHRWLHGFPVLRQLLAKWQGKKLLGSLYLLSLGLKVVVLDPDVLFFRRPKAIESWVRSSRSSDSISLFMVDYAFHSMLSSGEFLQYFGVRQLRQPLNSGLLCLAPVMHDLRKLSLFIQRVGEITRERLLSVRGEWEQPLNDHLLEQTAFMYLLSMKPSSPLPSHEYGTFLSLQSKKFWHSLPVVVHYTAEPSRTTFLWHYLRRRFFYEESSQRKR